MIDREILPGATDSEREAAEQLDVILANCHPLMAEAFYLAAVPHWYDLSLFADLRDKDDGRDEGLITRLRRYSFIAPLYDREEAEPAYFVRPNERSVLLKRWIAADAQAFREAHQRALAFWEANPDPDPFAHEQNLLYHRFFVDYDAGIEYLVRLFRAYRSERQLPAIERLLSTAKEARDFLFFLSDEAITGFDELLTLLEVRLAQSRGQWADSLSSLQTLRKKGDLLPSRLLPYVVRAHGYALAHEGQYVEAIEEYEHALGLFGQQADAGVDPANIQAERAYTMIALGDAHVSLAASVGGHQQREPREPVPGQRLRDFGYFLTSLPLVVYLCFYFGRRVWHPRSWTVLNDLDWIIARLFAAAVKYYLSADPILETQGESAEGVVADEKLANLYLAVGDAERAERLFTHLLTEVDAPLGAYRQASVRVGLGEAYVQLEQPRRALEPLRAALPVLAQYGDQELDARARELLAEASLATGDDTEAIQHFATSCRWYQAQKKWVEATRVVERLEAWERLGALSQAAMSKASEVIDSLQQRRYPGRYRHPALVRFRRLMLLLLPIVLVLAPLLSITLETSVVLTPQIGFQPLPLLNPEQKVVLELTPELTAAHVHFVVIPNSLLLLAAALVLVFFVFSFFLGLVVVAFTPLRSIQARGQYATVYLDDHGIAAGQEAQATRLLWEDVSQFVSADVCFWRRPLQDSSNFGLVATQEPLIVGAGTTRYATVRRRASGFLPSAADVINLDYTILRSKLGLLYVLTLLLVGLLGILAAFAKPSLILRDLPGTYYSLVDLYPYLLFFLVLAPLWWAVVQPLRQRLYLQPWSRFPLWMLGLGLLLALVQVILRFRPLLTVVNLYPPLITIIVLVSSGVVVWRAQAAGKKVYPLFLRLGTVVVVVVVCLLMATVLWRGVQAYHHVVRGNSIRDRALENQDVILSEAWMDRAIRAYEKAVKAGGGEIWGIDPKPGADIGIGIPAPHNLTWLSALTSQGALQTQRDQNPAAVRNFSEAFKFTERKDEIFVLRALARQSLVTEPAAQGWLTLDQTRYSEAVRDLNEAIKLNPNDASLYLWRGLAQHALEQWDDALEDYVKALQLDTSGDGPLAPDQQARTERALTGQGWIMYALEDYEGARDLFQQAREAGPDTSEAWLAEGYALYTLERFESVEAVWEEAARLDPKDPTVLISLGTLHWKFGGKTGRELERDRCTEYNRSVDYLNQALDRDRLWPQLDQDVAFTYRTLAQVQFLIGSHCTEGKEEMAKAHQDAVDNYSQALKLDPDNPDYLQMRGRLRYAVWRTLNYLGKGAEPSAWDLLVEGLADLDHAIRLRPDDKGNYEPNKYKRYIMISAFSQSLRVLEQGDEHFVSGDFAEALAHYELVAKKVPENLQAMFKTGLALLALGETEEALAQYETGLEQALAQDTTLDAQEALLELNTWAFELDLDAEAVVALFQEHGSALDVKDARTAFALGLATLKLGDQERALSWYRDGIELARAEGHLGAAEKALGELHLAFVESETLDADRVFSVFRAARIQLVPDNAQEAFSLALATLIKGERQQTVQLYSQAVEYAAADGDLGTVRAAAQTLREFLLEHPDVDPADAYWPLQDDPSAREDAVAELERPDLYWYYRAEFGYRLLNNRELFKRRLGEEKVYEEIYAGIIADIERAYALNPEEHQRMRDFFVDANIGWLFLRRGDDFREEGDLENALADYQEATRRIQPASSDAAGDLTEATFKAGLSALMLEDVEQATTWYEKAIQLADEYGSVFDLSTRVEAAVKALQALEEDRDFAPVIESILDELEQLQ